MATRLDRLGARRIDPSVPTVLTKSLRESWRTINQSDSVKYVVGAMEPIDPEYTKNTYVQGDRVKDQLAQALATNCDYRYQGSTTNDTHIKAASDIDLLVIIKRFFGVQPPLTVTNKYKGDPAKEMRDLRTDIVSTLSSKFPKATVDDEGSKSIVITGGSLTRKVDVVPADWLNTQQYVQSGNEVYRGVEVFDNATGYWIPNTPFLHNALVDLRDGRTQGGMRKAARLMKSLKYDTESIDLSSYDLVSIAYNIPESSLTVSKDQPLLILEACRGFVAVLQANQLVRDSIRVPDEHRTVFAPGHATLAGLNQLAAELQRLIADILTENARSFERLADARIVY